MAQVAIQQEAGLMLQPRPIGPDGFNKTTMYDLPFEMLEEMLTQACIAQKMQDGGLTYRDVYRALAPVCRLWRKILRKHDFFPRLRARVLAQDPSARFRHRPRQVVLQGSIFHSCPTPFSAVLLDKNQLYIIEKHYNQEHRALFLLTLSFRLRGNRRHTQIMTATKKMRVNLTANNGNVDPQFISHCPVSNHLLVFTRAGINDWNNPQEKMGRMYRCTLTGQSTGFWHLPYHQEYLQSAQVESTGRQIILLFDTPRGPCKYRWFICSMANGTVMASFYSSPMKPFLLVDESVNPLQYRPAISLGSLFPKEHKAGIIMADNMALKVTSPMFKDGRVLIKCRRLLSDAKFWLSSCDRQKIIFTTDIERPNLRGTPILMRD